MKVGIETDAIIVVGHGGIFAWSAYVGCVSENLPIKARYPG
jgi:hypothetical protein